MFFRISGGKPNALPTYHDDLDGLQIHEHCDLGMVHGIGLTTLNRLENLMSALMTARKGPQIDGYLYIEHR